MVHFRSCVTAALAVFSLLGSTLAVPLLDKLRGLTPGARDVLKRSTPAAPRFVIYDDAWVNPLPPAASLQGFNVYALSFWMTYGPADMAMAWQELTQSQRTSYLQEYNSAGISLIVSAFGSTDAPTSAGDNPATLADKLAAWVVQYGLQGVDIDYEDFDAFNSKQGTAEPWLITLTQQLRTHLPQGQYILSHAPVAPWFAPGLWSGGGYLQIHKTVGSLIDYYNLQFYNQGTSEYTTCDGLLTASTSQWPQTALFQIAANGVDVNKLVIGKPGTSGDANNGYMSTATLASCVAQAAASGWKAGVMVWEYPHVGSSWITAVRGNTWPVSVSDVTEPASTGSTASSVPTPQSTPSGSSTTSLTTTSPSPTTTAVPRSSQCSGVSSWANNAAYVGGTKVTYDGHLWVATWWNEGETPGGPSGAWTDDGACT